MKELSAAQLNHLHKKLASHPEFKNLLAKVETKMKALQAKK